ESGQVLSNVGDMLVGQASACQSPQCKRAGSDSDRMARAQPADADGGARLGIVHNPPRGIRHADLTRFSSQELFALRRIVQVVGARVDASSTVVVSPVH